MSGREFLSGKIVVQLKPGMELEQIAAHRDVRQGHAIAATAIDGGPVELAVKRFSDDLRVSRAFTSRKNVTLPGKRHLAWDPLEHRLGLSRTFRVAVHPLTNVRALCAELASLAQVEMASPQYLCRTPSLESKPEQPDELPDDSRALIGAGRALEMEPGDPTLIIGLVDSGAQTEHPELAGRLRPGLTTVTTVELAGSVHLLSGPHSRQDISDDEGHGTACASIIGANGLQLPRGLAGSAMLLAVRALAGARLHEQDRPTAIGNLSDIDSAMKSTVDLGARVLNLSFGTPQSALEPDDPIPHISVVRYALGRECVLVSASGNSGQDEIFFPAALPGVIAVGSIGPDRRRSSFSTGGPHLALCAPGEGIRVAALQGYARMNGTSFAAPLVAGAAALMIARAMRRSTPLTASAVRDLLQRSAAPFASGDARTSPATCGAGVLDVPAALEAVNEESQAEAA